ncbi:hypothetical protein PAEAM_52490 [Paenibacillus sp. GM1FR]|nr:hypothetical protein PAEAM_52490 [Paenibacillus sp. GM1FR]
MMRLLPLVGVFCCRKWKNILVFAIGIGYNNYMIIAKQEKFEPEVILFEVSEGNN